MVSKVAVIALVAIVACPILLGYAMNLSEVTETDYKTTGDSVNVTPLLFNSIDYDDVSANIYQLNSNFVDYASNGSNKTVIVPQYNRISSVASSQRYSQNYLPNWGGGAGSLSGMSTYDVAVSYTNSLNNYLTAKFYDNGTLVLTVDRLISYHFENQKVYYIYYSTPNTQTTTTNTYQFTNATACDYVFHGFSTVPLVYGYSTPNMNSYVDIAKGYYFNYFHKNPGISLPEGTKSFIMSINLDSITDANYDQVFAVSPDSGTTLFYLKLIKTTVGGNVTWQFDKSITGTFNNPTDLYYNQSKSNNTYQLYVNLGSKEQTSATNEKATVNCSLKYVGDWPTVIGAANPYYSYDFQFGHIAPIANNFYNSITKITMDHNNTRTPTIRMDNAIVKGMGTQVFVDQVYDPADFKTNPSTTIGEVTKYGSAITFGGNTYNVSKGSITIGSHSIPVRGLVFSSVPNSNGDYDNMIGNTVVSSSAQPSTITFNGHWSASISTQSMESYTYTKTEWTPGQFGWNGIDQNFLMVGLLTSIGVFIALGIYIRRTKANLWPLLLVCGGAVVLFFCML